MIERVVCWVCETRPRVLLPMWLRWLLAALAVALWLTVCWYVGFPTIVAALGVIYLLWCWLYRWPVG